ncbi:DUF1499 domain-containing protein [Pseudoroseicyclus sp. CLL3-39]|uniref:DUF1499 domain-containing protein n=1 Tax=Pseudoroseicyclus tamaricis TaxID=2705421 RepID=A0A6B2JZU8_9RHOB|nr:DUF1499 domain-containing protein [Pseudoroseicyclus tamaricis]
MIVLAVVIVAFGLYVRLAPTDPEEWHIAAPNAPPGDYPAEGAFIAVRPVTEPGPEVLSRLDAIALDTPRTHRVAGSPAEGMITWVSRSALWGFPDFTTARVEDGKLTIHGRLRFGRGDMGVNRKRVERWLAQLEARAPGA